MPNPGCKVIVPFHKDVVEGLFTHPPKVQSFMRDTLDPVQQAWLSDQAITTWEFLLLCGFYPSLLTKKELHNNPETNPLYEATLGPRAMLKMLPFGSFHECFATIHHKSTTFTI